MSSRSSKAQGRVALNPKRMFHRLQRDPCLAMASQTTAVKYKISKFTAFRIFLLFDRFFSVLPWGFFAKHHGRGLHSLVPRFPSINESNSLFFSLSYMRIDGRYGLCDYSLTSPLQTMCRIKLLTCSSLFFQNERWERVSVPRQG